MASGQEESAKSGAKEILSQIFCRIGELSDALSNDRSSSNTSNSDAVNATVESEVSRVFGRQQSSSTSSSTATISSTASNTTRHSSVNISPSPQRVQESSPLYNSRRYFGNQRSSIKSSRKRKGKDAKPPKISSGPFSRDVILLAGPVDTDIPRQGSKVFLQENGHIISAFEFYKEWSDIDVQLEIRQAFQGKLPDVDIEIVHSVHTTLLAPTLAPGQHLNGSVINRVFSNNKPVYIRPSREILHQLKKKEKRQRYELPDNVFGDDDDDDWNNMDSPACLLHEKKYQTVNKIQLGETSPDPVGLSFTDTQVLDESISLIKELNNNQPEELMDPVILTDYAASNLYLNEESRLPQGYHDWIIDEHDISNNQIEENEQSVKEIAIHRNNVLKDMITAFKDETILNGSIEIVFIDDRGNIEEGRGSGVKREALSIFWREFYNSLATGAFEKVPAIRHDYQKSEWQSVARVLVTGFTKLRYFPVTLSRAFVASCLFPEESLPTKWLLESFYQYISKDESESLKRSLTAECLDPSSDEDVLDVLPSFKCYRMVTRDSMPKILEELAHQELIQRPKYIANAWFPILKLLKRFKEFENVDSLVNLLEDKKPTQKKVCKLLTSNPATDAQKECFSHLKRFVKSLDDNLLSAFLQFVSGSNVIAVDSIEVAFSEEIGAARRPIAHTCAPLLIIPATYQSYNELSEEFSNIFREIAAWAFCIV